MNEWNERTKLDTKNVNSQRQNIELYGWQIQWHKSHFVTVNVKILPTTPSPFAMHLPLIIAFTNKTNNTLDFISLCVWFFLPFFYGFRFKKPLHTQQRQQQPQHIRMDLESDSLAHHWMVRVLIFHLSALLYENAVIAFNIFRFIANTEKKRTQTFRIDEKERRERGRDGSVGFWFCHSFECLYNTDTSYLLHGKWYFDVRTHSALCGGFCRRKWRR